MRTASRLVRLDDDLLDVLDALQVAAPAHHELAARELDEAPADLVVALPDRLDDARRCGDAVRRERVRVDGDLVLLLEPADGRDLGDARARDCTA